MSVYARGVNMAHRIPMTDELSFAMQLKNLANEELLDFWAETQQIEGMMQQEYPQAVGSQDYERLIVLELQLRSCNQNFHPCL